MHSSIAAGGSVHIGDNMTSVTVAKPVFSEINLEAYDDDSYISPRFTGKLVGEIIGMRTGRMAVFTGFYGFDMVGFTKHLAFKIAEEFANAGEVISAKACFLNSDFSSIAVAIKENPEDCIFVLNNLTPKDVGHDLEKLQKVAEHHLHKIIILASTNLPLSAWKNPHADYWFAIDQDGLYHTGVKLASDIYERNKLTLYLRKSCDKRKLFTYKSKLTEVVEKLIPTEINTPEQLSLLLDLFAKKPTEDEKVIKNLVAQTKKKDNLLREWFDSLDDDKQLVALGMSLLDGVYDEQFFAIMQQLFEEAWASYSTSLIALDYSDLNSLLHFFSFTSGDRPALEGKFPYQRFQTLFNIWGNYRRRIAATFPIMVHLVAQSVNENIASLELYGDRDKRIRLRETIAQALSDVGRISPQTVEPWLLQLAAHGNIGVQLVAAKALAQWREKYEDPNIGHAVNKENELFELLYGWNEDSRRPNSRIAQLRKSLFKEESAVSSSAASAYVRATILLTLGAASAYDNTNLLHPKILDLVKTFARDRNELVVRRLRDTLRLLVRNHPWQIGERLFDLGGSSAIFNELSHLEDYADAIAMGLADAHVDFPGDVEGLLEDWLNFCEVERPKHLQTEILSFREKILATIIYTYMSLDLSGLPLLDKAATDIENLRQKEHHPAIRQTLLYAILSFYEKYFSVMEARHSKKIPNMHAEERKQVALTFRTRYLAERDDAAGGDYEVRIEGFRIESWRNREDRPLTQVEKSLGEWVGSSNENLMRIALQAFIEFSKIEAWEEEQVRQYLEGMSKAQNERTAFTPPKYDDSVRRGLMSTIWSTLFGGGNKIKENLLPMVREDENMGEPQLKILKEKLKVMGYTI